MAKPPFPLTCVTWTDFQKNPSLVYGLFHRNGPKGFRHDPEKVTVLDSMVADGATSSFFVNSVEMFDAVRNKLVNRLLVFVIQCHFAKTRDVLFRKQTKLPHDKLVLLVNTADPKISSEMISTFAEARKLLEAGVTFKLVINFEMSVGTWYPSLFKGEHTEEVSPCTGAEITISNQALSSRCCYCGSIFCVLCFPLWLFISPCYRIYHGCTHEDPFLKFGELPVAIRIEVPPGITADICQDPNTDEDKVVVSRNGSEPDTELSTSLLQESLANTLKRNEAAH